MQTESTPFLVEPEALIGASDARLGDDVLLVDVRPEADYAAGHLPGARCVPPGMLVGGIQPATGRLPDQARLQALANLLGLGPNRLIIAYDAEGGGWAGRLIWTLAVLGHPLMAYLNGGLPAWVAAGGSLVQGGADDEAQAASVATATAPVRINSKYLIDFEALLQNHRQLTIWDTRSLKEYTGETAFSAQGGHIPGALHLDWLELINAGDHLKLKPNLRQYLAERGLTEKQHIVTHCQTHHRSGLTWLVGRLLGFPDIKAYDGSWSEWGNRPEAPVVRGEAPG